MSTSIGIRRNSSFVHWLARNNKDYRTSSGATHLLLSGGKIRIEPNEEEQVLQCLADDITNGFYNYVIEMRTPVFRFCQDWDFLAYEGIAIETMLEYFAVVQEVLCAVLPDLPASKRIMLVCSAPNDAKQGTVEIVKKRFIKGFGRTDILSETSVRQDMVKCGVHTYFPHIFVTQADAIRIRFVLLQAMEHRFPRAFEKVTFEEGTNETSDVQITQHVIFDTWDKVLDLTIYTANGLRILGSRKAVFCCKRQDGDCAKCQNTRKIDLGRPYTMTMAIDANAECLEELTTKLIEDPKLALEMTTIRTQQTEHERIAIPEWFTNNKAMADKVKQFCGIGRKRKNRPDALRGEDDLEGGWSAGGWGPPGSTKEMPVNNKMHAFEVLDTQSDVRARRFQMFLRDNLDSAYGPIQLKRMMICMDKGAYRIYAVPTTRYCANVAREHHGQEIFFRYSEREGVTQGCWSTVVESDRLHGDSCKSTEAKDFFAKRSVKMNASMHAAIFTVVEESDSGAMDIGTSNENRQDDVVDEEEEGGTMKVLGSADLDKAFRSWYALHHVTSRRKFSWFSEDPDAEMRAVGGARDFDHQQYNDIQIQYGFAEDSSSSDGE